MSSLLKEAIVDAKALRDAALKNAEHAVINKYAGEVRQTLNVLLEQEDPFDLGGLEDIGDMEMPKPEGHDEEFIEDTKEVPYSATNDLSGMEGSRNLSDIPATDELAEITLDLGALNEHAKSLQENFSDRLAAADDNIGDTIDEYDESEEVSEEKEKSWEELLEMMAEDSEPIEEVNIEIEEEAEEELSEDLADAILEKLTVDMGADLSGWAGRSSKDVKYQMEKELAHRRSTDEKEELENLKKAQEELVFENKNLNKRIKHYKQAINEFKEGLQEINLSNARLLYTNRVLRNTSLNERQKNKIVEAISKADSVPQARTIFNTLESTVEAAPKSSPQSLSEAINRRSSIIRATRTESAQPVDIFAERMKKLAGIK
jgi:hypothetical protein